MSELSIYNPEQANHLVKLATQFSKSALVPAHFRGKPDDCFVALEMAQRLNMTPFMVLQNLYVVHGRPGFSAQFLIALANRSGVFTTPVMFRESGKGDSLAVTAYAIHAASDEEVSFEVSMAMAKGEGWTKNIKYQTMPKLMLRYRAATLLIRTHCPEVTMGMQTSEELTDLAASGELEVSAPPYVEDEPKRGAAGARAALKMEEKPEPAEDPKPEQDNREKLIDAIQRAKTTRKAAFDSLLSNWGVEADSIGTMLEVDLQRFLNELIEG